MWGSATDGRTLAQLDPKHGLAYPTNLNTDNSTRFCESGLWPGCNGNCLGRFALDAIVESIFPELAIER